MKFTCWAARSARAAQQWGPYGDSGPMSLVLLQANARVDAPKRASAPCMLPCRRTHSPGPGWDDGSQKRPALRSDGLGNPDYCVLWCPCRGDYQAGSCLLTVCTKCIEVTTPPALSTRGADGHAEFPWAEAMMRRGLPRAAAERQPSNFPVPATGCACRIISLLLPGTGKLVG
jgi:hypothetical protein